ncbi:transposase [Polynucleobacter arcticus]|uniref:transposase n=1 Tax=Polynucleobacter arcticus TaxID=1743165 RepID=UPI00156F7FB0|nr:transposase [Polynucleobacter arcticus]
MSKYSKQFKLKVVKEFLKSGGLKRVSHLFEISHSVNCYQFRSTTKESFSIVNHCSTMG